MNEEYYLGLDVGTSSVGWAVADEGYHILKKAGKSLWGVRLFEEGQTAADRRIHRSSRRRYGRKKMRLGLLKEIFAPEIAQVDESFFLRLSESRYWPEDKPQTGKYTLFNDENYTDADYHSQFPTIYHLRKELMESDTNEDIRLLYLAVLHIVKHRGHFLNEGVSLNEGEPMDWSAQLPDQLNGLQTAFNQVFLEDGEDIHWDHQKLEEILLSEEDGIAQKKKNVAEEVVSSDKQLSKLEKEWLQFLVSGSSNMKKLFPDLADLASEVEKIQLSAGSEEELLDPLSAFLTDEQRDLLLAAYQVYGTVQLAKLLPGTETLSEAKVHSYEKHQSDLRSLKDVVREYAPERYGEVFRSNTQKANYCHYVGKANVDGKHLSLTSTVKADEFYKYIRTVLKKADDKDERVQKILKEMDKGTFLPKQKTSDNSYIPYQVHELELKKILANAEKKFPFLKTLDPETGLTNTQKILKLFSFRIPYYVGPLNDAHRKDNLREGYCWLVKKDAQPVTPFNFEEVIDFQATEEAFIKRLTNTCTYLIAEDVLPESSLIYSRFTVLNELNNLKVRGEPISVELKQRIFHELFLQEGESKIRPSRKVTMKMLLRFLKSMGYEDLTSADLSGFDQDFKSTLRTELEFKQIFGDQMPERERLEEIIQYLTVSSGDPKLLYSKIKTLLPEGTEDAVIKKVCRIKTGEWGRLSKKLLTGLTVKDPITGVPKTILQKLYETNLNLMQLLAGQEGFSQAIQTYNSQFQTGTTEMSYHHLVQGLYASPAVKRSIWQTLLVVEELVRIQGTPPKRIYLEMARESNPEQKGKRTVSRKDQLDALYKSCKKEIRAWDAEAVQKHLNEVTNEQLRSDRLYLYLSQMGRCMYSGEPIEISQLWNKDLYDVDHIYPRSKVKDDSLNNKVLVKRTLNQTVKKDRYPVPEEFRKNPKVQSLWKMLLEKGMISKEKYTRLTRNAPFTEEELAGFINRQLVETRQSTKLIADLLKELYPDTKIVYVKASLVSDFRQVFDLVKVRDLNDFHHAKDAYLNIVAGNVYYEKFTNHPLNFIQSAKGRKEGYSMKPEVFFGHDLVRNGKTIWKGLVKQKDQSMNPDASIHTVKRLMNKNDILVSRKTYIPTGELFDVQPVKAKKGLFPLKGASCDTRLQETQKYGGYNSEKGSIFSLVEVKGKGRCLEHIPRRVLVSDGSVMENIRHYLQAKYGHDVKVLVREIKAGSLLKVDGCFFTLNGHTKSSLKFANATELILPVEMERYVKNLFKFKERKQKDKTIQVREKYDGITAELNENLFDLLAEKMNPNSLEPSIYSKSDFFSGKFKDLYARRKTFVDLPIEKQVEVLTDLILFFQCNAKPYKTDGIGGTAQTNLTKTNNISSKSYREVILINQSVTGFFTSSLDLKNMKSL